MQQKKPLFKATSKKRPYVDATYRGPKQTRIHYILGELNGKKAVQFFYKGKPHGFRYSQSKAPNPKFDIADYGGQSLNAAQYQREACLYTIVARLFKKHGFTVTEEPELMAPSKPDQAPQAPQTPDVLATKGAETIYIELKAFHRNYITGDPEIAQCLKYFEKCEEVHQVECKDEKNNKALAQVVLITSGNLLAKKDSFLGNPQKEPLEHVKNFYKQRTVPRSTLKTLDESSARDIYSHALKKFQRKYGKGFNPDIKIIFSNDGKIADVHDFLFSNKKFDVLLLSAEHFEEILLKEKMNFEKHKFELLRRTSLEKLILNAKILTF